MTVPKAPVSASPVWPVSGVRKVVHTHGGKSFGASRAAGQRYHAGIDILAPKGATVVATDDGTLVAAQPFNGPKAHALLLQTDFGPVVLYGEVLPESWSDYGLKLGDRVSKGQPIAKIGVNPGGSTMLHFEMYRAGTRSNQRWYPNMPPPPSLYDPTDYLAKAARGELEEEDTGPDHDHPTDDLPTIPPVVTPPHTPPVVPPTVPPVVVRPGIGGGLLAFAVLALLAMTGGKRRG